MLVEGAGSASEVNLRANDIANMGFARAAGVPVVLIGDIDRGGVIASLVGTKAVIDAEGRGADPRASSSTGSAATRPVRRRHGADRAGAPAGRRSGSCRTSPTRAGCRPRTRWRSSSARAARRRARADRRADPAAHRQFRRSRSARRRARRRARAGASGRGAAGRRRSRHPAGLEGDDRRSRGAARRGLGHRHRGASCAAAAGCSASAAATRCWAARSPIPTASRARRRRSTGLGLLDVETC